MTNITKNVEFVSWSDREIYKFSIPDEGYLNIIFLDLIADLEAKGAIYEVWTLRKWNDLFEYQLLTFVSRTTTRKVNMGGKDIFETAGFRSYITVNLYFKSYMVLVKTIWIILVESNWLVFFKLHPEKVGNSERVLFLNLCSQY
jgi:hypothetical protein